MLPRPFLLLVLALLCPVLVRSDDAPVPAQPPCLSGPRQPPRFSVPAPPQAILDTEQVLIGRERLGQCRAVVRALGGTLAFTERTDAQLKADHRQAIRVIEEFLAAVPTAPPWIFEEPERATYRKLRVTLEVILTEERLALRADDHTAADMVWPEVTNLHRLLANLTGSFLSRFPRDSTRVTVTFQLSAGEAWAALARLNAGEKLDPESAYVVRGALQRALAERDEERDKVLAEVAAEK